MNLFFFVEEPSIETLLRILLPRLITNDIYSHFITFRGKPDLLRKLESRLRAYAHWVTNEYRFMVLIDRDNDDCHELKMNLENISVRAGFSTKSKPKGEYFQLVNRIVIEELEAWYFGDTNALHRAYPRISADLHQNPRYRNPDNISSGTWETLERILQRAGYYQTGLSKIQLATDIGPYMTPDINRSRSFQVFLEGFYSLINN